MNTHSFDIQTKNGYYYFVEIGGKIIVIGKSLKKLGIVDSTNNYIKKHYETLNDGTIVFASQQTAGRGRSNHLWMSEEGNLYFSFIIKKEVLRNKIFNYTILTSMAVINLLKSLNIEAKIKYPNDILINDKKICGILIESFGSKEIEYVVVGVGININQLDFKELSAYAISLRQITNKDYKINETLNNFIKEYNLLEKSTYSKVVKEYVNYSMIIGKKIKIEGNLYEIKGITEAGEIVVKNKNEQKRLILNSINIKELL